MKNPFNRQRSAWTSNSCLYPDWTWEEASYSSTCGNIFISCSKKKKKKKQKKKSKEIGIKNRFDYSFPK